MNDSAVRHRVVIHGLVQGVFFRDGCRREAEIAGVAGWVRNLPDGTVEAVFEGDPEGVRTMIDWVHKGPPAARVDRVAVSEESVVGELAFRIR